MQIDVNLNLDERLKELDVSKLENPLAKGWIEIEGAIKFPVRVMKYTDKEDNKEKMFVSFPQKKNGDKYDELVQPVNDEIRKEVQEIVLKEFTKALQNSVVLSATVTDVRVNLLKEPVTTGSVTLNAMASATICGFQIHGIQVKESSKGMFVQMPQYKAGNEYHDTVYGTTAPVQKELRDKILEAYEQILNEKKQQLEEKPEEVVPNFGTQEEKTSENPDAHEVSTEISANIQHTVPKRHRLI